MRNQHYPSRRRFLQALACTIGGVFSGLIGPGFANAGAPTFITKPIPSSNERIPVVGLGSSRTFNVGNDPLALDNVAEVMRHFLMRVAQ